MRLTIADIARLANVSKATVSTVLNDKPGISQKTRDKVLSIVRKYDYRPSHLARALSARTTKSIGLVIKEIINPYFARIMKGVFEACAEKEYTVLLGTSELSPEKEQQSIETLITYRVDGLIISPLQGDDVDFSYLADLMRDKYPLITLNGVHNFQTHVVDIDNVKAAYEAVSYLIKLGHKRIAYFAGPNSSAHNIDRMQGYQQALIDHNLPMRKSDLVQTGSYTENGYVEGRKYFYQNSDKPTAVLCYNDLVAIGLVNALLELNISVPQSVSVIGFDDIDFCKSFKIPLTTMSVPAYEIGRAAAELLIKLIHNDSSGPNEKIVFDSKLIARASCAQIN